MWANAEVPWVQSHRNHQTGGNRSQYPWGAINAAQSCRAMATTSRGFASQLSNLHWPGVGISNKNKIILAQNTADVKLPRVYLMLFRVDLCPILNYFCILKKENYAQRCRSRTQAHFWQNAIQSAGMLRILSSLLNKARSGEVHWINTVSVYHELNGLAIIPESMWRLCGISICYA